MVNRNSQDFAEDAANSTCYGHIYSNLSMYGTKMTDVNISSCMLEDSLFVDVEFLGSIFSDCDLTDVEFRMCDLTGLVLSGLNLSGITFVDCKVEDLDLSGSSLQDCSFLRCDGAIIGEDTEFLRVQSYCSDFAESNFINSMFSECEMLGTDFSKADFEYASMIEVDFARSTFVQAKLNFSCAHLVNFSEVHTETGDRDKTNYRRTPRREITKQTYQVCHNAVLIEG